MKKPKPYRNLSTDNLRSCDTVALGTAMTLVREYGHEWDDFVAKHPELVCPFIPSEPFRAFLVSGE